MGKNKYEQFSLKRVPPEDSSGKVVLEALLTKVPMAGKGGKTYKPGHLFCVKGYRYILEETVTLPTVGVTSVKARPA